MGWVGRGWESGRARGVVGGRVGWWAVWRGDGPGVAGVGRAERAGGDGRAGWWAEEWEGGGGRARELGWEVVGGISAGVSQVPYVPAIAVAFPSPADLPSASC